ncbi:hypothetical protein [Fusibacter sp. JL216-2]|uniref:hypothetical protein n=1 Tax=Fusibacter sp. JL216-2 TaxID=3071453 RepID=UPI003D3444C9
MERTVGFPPSPPIKKDHPIGWSFFIALEKESNVKERRTSSEEEAKELGLKESGANGGIPAISTNKKRKMTDRVYFCVPYSYI